LILLNFLWKNCSIFNYPCTIGLNTTKAPRGTLPIKGFPIVPRAQQGVHGLGDLNMTNKTNKLSSIMDRFSSWDKM
jgi:hypothetical protein